MLTHLLQLLLMVFSVINRSNIKRKKTMIKIRFEELDKFITSKLPNVYIAFKDGDYQTFLYIPFGSYGIVVYKRVSITQSPPNH